MAGLQHSDHFLEQYIPLYVGTLYDLGAEESHYKDYFLQYAEQIEAQAGFFTIMTLKLNYFSLRLIRGPWPLRKAINLALHLCWYVGQKVAPILDRLDTRWALETNGYFLAARKP